MGSNLTCADVVMTVPKTDGQIAVPLSPGIALSGTWTPTNSTNGTIVTRTPSTSTQHYRLPVVIPHRTTALKGAEIISYTVSYSVSVGDVDADGIVLTLLKQTIPTDGSAVTGSIVAGNSEDHYDASHNSTTKRLATGAHTVKVTLPTPAYIADGVQYYLNIKVTDGASADLGFSLTGVVVNYIVAPL